MKLSLPYFLLLVLTLISCVHSSPAGSSESVAIVEKPLLVRTHQLVERDLKYPVKCNDALVNKIMASVKADLYAKVFGSITATVS